MNFVRFLLPLLLVLLSVSQFGCRESAEARFDRAQQYADERDFRNAVLELKSLLQDSPNNVRARWLLGRIYLDVEDGSSAEKELKRARELGVTDDSVLPWLAEALLAQGKFDSVLALSPTTGLSALSTAELKAQQALALLATGEVGEAESVIQLALAEAPDSPSVRLSHAGLLIWTRQVEEARSILERLVEENATNGRAWSVLAGAYELQKVYDKAEGAYSEAIKYRFLPLNDYAKRGLTRVALGKIDDADKDAQVLLKLAPKWFLGHFLKAVVLLNRGYYAEAAASLDSALAENERYFPAIFAAAVAERELRNNEKALSLARRAHFQEPFHVPARLLLAKMYLDLRQPADAESLVRLVVEQRPDDNMAKELLGASLVGQGKIDEASDLFEQLVSEPGVDASVQLKAGSAFLASGRKDAALEAFSRAIELSPAETGVSKTVVETLLVNSFNDLGLKAANDFLSENPDRADAWNLVGVANLVDGNQKEAKLAFEHALQLEPGNSAANQHLAVIALQQGDVESARHLLEMALQSSPEDAEVLYRLASMERQLGNKSKSFDLLQRATEVAPQLLRPKVDLARLKLVENQPKAALDVLSGVSASDPAVLHTRAIAHFHLGEYTDALLSLEKLRTLTPDNAGVHLQLARVYAELGDTSALEKSLDRVVELVPDSPDVSLVRARLMILQQRFNQAAVLLDTIPDAANPEGKLAARLQLARATNDHAGELRIAKAYFDAYPGLSSAKGLAKALLRNNQGQQAKTVLDEWFAAHHGDFGVLNLLAEVNLSMGDVDGALRAWRQKLVGRPDDAIALNNLAWYLRKSRPREALKYAENAYAIDSESLFVIDTMAEVLALNGEKARALEVMNDGVRLSGRSPGMVMRRVEIRMLVGETNEAKQEILAMLGSRDLTPELTQRATSILSALNAITPE